LAVIRKVRIFLKIRAPRSIIPYMKIRTTLALAVAAALAGSAPAEAATTASGNQAVTASPTSTLTATFPSDYAWGALAVGAGNLSAEQFTTVQSNEQWGLKISSDEAAGHMRRWDGGAYVAGSLQDPLQWALTSVGGVPEGAPTYDFLNSTPATVATTQPLTDNSGTAVGVKFKQVVSFGDDADIGSDVYRLVVTYDAQQGF
jgi:hypothetical protein